MDLGMRIIRVGPPDVPVTARGGGGGGGLLVGMLHSPRKRPRPRGQHPCLRRRRLGLVTPGTGTSWRRDRRIYPGRGPIGEGRFHTSESRL
eukprot:6493787-Pyramimonas_sp.AAC.4